MNFLKLIKNFLEHLTKEPSALIVDEPTSEKITMEKTIEPVSIIRDWSIERINLLADGGIKSQFDAVAISEEFDEWININPNQEELVYLAIEPMEWTEDQEIDTM